MADAKIVGDAPLDIPRDGLLPHRPRRNAKAIKALEAKRSYILGHDVYMDRVEALCRQALVGRLEYLKMNLVEMIR